MDLQIPKFKNIYLSLLIIPIKQLRFLNSSAKIFARQFFTPNYFTPNFYAICFTPNYFMLNFYAIFFTPNFFTPNYFTLNFYAIFFTPIYFTPNCFTPFFYFPPIYKFDTYKIRTCQSILSHSDLEKYKRKIFFRLRKRYKFIL